jgi:hypothetical protein
VAGSPYTITPSGATGGTFTPGNYNITYNPGNLTVNQAPLTIAAIPQTNTYGQTLSFGAGSILFTSSVLSNNETIGTVTLAVSGNGGAPTAPVAGTPYTITPSAATGGTFTPGNYNINYKTAYLTVNPALLTVTASPQSKTYGQTLSFGPGSALFGSSTLANGETIGSVTLAVSGNGGAATATVAGSPYTITPSAATAGTFNANNYAITYVTNLLTVNQTNLTITANNRTKTYGQTVVFAGTEFTDSTLLNGDTITGVTLSSAGAAANASLSGSPYQILPSLAVGSGLGNYNISYADGLLSVSGFSLTIAPNFPNVVLTWTTNAATAVLNQAASLTPPVSWAPVTNSKSVSGTNSTVTVSGMNGNQFYLLKAP